MKDLQQARSEELIALIAHFATEDGDHTTDIPGLSVHRRSSTGCKSCGAYGPGFALIAQGAKQVVLGEDTYRYGGANYLLSTLDLPVTTQIIEATAHKPYLSFTFRIDTAKIAQVMDRAVLDPERFPPPTRGMSVSTLTPELEDASIRLLQLLHRLDEVSVMLPLIEQEIIYRLLLSSQSGRLRQMALSDSQSQQINRACQWLKENYTLPLKIEDLAQRVNMSVSSLHHHFKAMTAMSPMQYQKQLRLQEARRLMLEEMLDAGSAGHHVGYESQSQFSREYARQFGAPPLRDIGRVRRGLIERLGGELELAAES